MPCHLVAPLPAGADSCKECPVGTIPNDNASDCVLCGEGLFNNVTGATACTACPAGEFLDGGRWREGTGGMGTASTGVALHAPLDPQPPKTFASPRCPLARQARTARLWPLEMSACPALLAPTPPPAPPSARPASRALPPARPALPRMPPPSPAPPAPLAATPRPLVPSSAALGEYRGGRRLAGRARLRLSLHSGQ